MTAAVPRRALAEAVATLLLVAIVVGSGIQADAATTDGTVALLANTVATAGGLVALIVAFGPVSSAHMNPAVTAVEVARGAMGWRDLAWYAPAQIAGAIGGAVLANLMFDLPAVDWSTKDRAHPHLWLGEVVATFALVTVVLALGRAKARPAVAGLAVAAVITAGYFFTSSTSFANPAVTIGRAFTDTFAGIAPTAVAPFVAAQALGAALALGVHRAVHGGVPSVDPATTGAPTPALDPPPAGALS